MRIQTITSSKHERTLSNKPWQFPSLLFRQNIYSVCSKGSQILLVAFVICTVCEGWCSCSRALLGNRLVLWTPFGHGNKIATRVSPWNVLCHVSKSTFLKMCVSRPNTGCPISKWNMALFGLISESNINSFFAVFSYPKSIACWSFFNGAFQVVMSHCYSKWSHCSHICEL